MDRYEESLARITEHFCGLCRKSCVKCEWHDYLMALSELVEDKYIPVEVVVEVVND